MTSESSVDEIMDTPASDAPTPLPDPPPSVAAESDEASPEPSRDPLAALKERDHPFD
jgi:hypothetical protein